MNGALRVLLIPAVFFFFNDSWVSFISIFSTLAWLSQHFKEQASVLRVPFASQCWTGVLNVQFNGANLPDVSRFISVVVVFVGLGLV